MNAFHSKALYFTAAVLMAGFIAMPAHAAIKERELTEANVTDFIEEMSTMIADSKKSSDHTKVNEYLKEHLHDESSFNSVMTYNLPNQPPKETAMSLNKEDFMKSLETGKDALSDYKYELDIENIKIAEDGRSATAHTKNTESGIMTLPDQGELREIPVEGTSECDQDIILHNGTIMMKSANCATTVNFHSPGQEEKIQ